MTKENLHLTKIAQLYLSTQFDFHLTDKLIFDPCCFIHVLIFVDISFSRLIFFLNKFFVFFLSFCLSDNSHMKSVFVGVT